ncbi:hypothetical protein CYMTET_27421 [Cymbomonas tetramitiformis]|uniref:Uncharacterized protein n=1 Tax=Cymbomonas tetramitiformis TaxID=36881 RepID=A0AAE0FPT9_9CHLO|nr:hypothetical protein CYMTET_27421 [Cymbomonas tetramitiformis]
MESAAVVRESIDEYQSLPGEAKRENTKLPAIAEYFLGHLRTMPYGPSVAAEVLDMTSNEGLLRYIRTNDRLMQTLMQEVGMPKVKPLHVIKAKREEIAASIGLSENDDGSLAEVDLHSKIAAVIKQMRDSQTGLLHTRTARTADELECFLYGDAHGTYRGKKVDGHYVSCCLHWLLRQVDAAFMHTVHAHADTDEKAQALTAQLKAHGISVSKAIKKWQAYKAAKDRAGSATFIGDHAVVVLAEYDSYLDLHTPMGREDIYEASWLAMVHTYECIHEVMEDTPENREKKAKAIAEAAQVLAWAWEDAAPSSRPPYIHIAMVHIPRAVLKHGTNVDQYSGQGIEHLGKLRQIWQQCAANCKARQMRD